MCARSSKVAWLLSAGAILLSAAGAEPIPAVVTAVAAGDLLSVEYNGNTTEIRLYGVDCPEAGQPFSDEAKQFVTKKAFKQEVTVDVLTTDNLGKSVATVRLPDGTDLSQALVAAGLAWCDRENAANDRTLNNLNAKAITEQAGLWKDAVALSPRDYRESHGMPQFTYSVAPKPRALPEPAPEEPKSISAKGNEVYKGGFSIDASTIQFDQNVDVSSLLMQHTPTIATDANGNPLGLTAPGISSIPYAGQLGFQDGDIVTAVNGEPIRDLSQLLSLVDRFKNAKSLNINVLRGGRPTTVTISLP